MGVPPDNNDDDLVTLGARLKVSVLLRILNSLLAAGTAAFWTLLLLGFSLYRWPQDDRDRTVGLVFMGLAVLVFAGCVGGYIFLKRPIPATAAQYDLVVVMETLQRDDQRHTVPFAGDAGEHQ